MSMRTWCGMAALTAWMVGHVQARPVERTVKVQEANLLSQASFFSPRVATLAYGDHVVVLGTQGTWVRVQRDDRTGWLPTSSLTERRTALAATGDTGTGVTTQETTLAGKGLSQRMEDEYKTLRPEADFKGVDKVEARKVSREQVLAFLRAGGLAGGAP